MDDRTTHIQDRQSQLETEMRHLKLQLAVAAVMIIMLLLWRFPHAPANAMAFCKQGLGLPVTSPIRAPADAHAAPQQKTQTATVVSPVITQSIKAMYDHHT